MSLGTMVLATLFADLLAWTLVVTGVEHFAIRPGITATNPLDLYDYPISHSLATDVLWGTLLAAIYYLFRRYWRGTVLVFFLVISHWFLDLIAHRPDMPLAPGIHRYYGFGLHNSRPGMIVVASDRRRRDAACPRLNFREQFLNRDVVPTMRAPSAQQRRRRVATLAQGVSLGKKAVQGDVITCSRDGTGIPNASREWVSTNKASE